MSLESTYDSPEVQITCTYGITKQQKPDGEDNTSLKKQLTKNKEVTFDNIIRMLENPYEEEETYIKKYLKIKDELKKIIQDPPRAHKFIRGIDRY